jgi:hypothetical protein
VVFSLGKDATEINADSAKAVQGTPSGGAHTLRWYADRDALYWITIGADGGALWVTHDGDAWTRVALPADAGRPADILRVGDHLLVLTERRLLELGADGVRERARIEDKKTPFKVDDAYCAPPLAVFAGVLHAGGQRKGALYRLVAD